MVKKIKKVAKALKKASALHKKQSKVIEKHIKEMKSYGKKRDPKVGTGKKPKGSGRRLYTDENPKDTVGIKFATPTDARKTVAKVKKVNKPFARKIQILTVGEQRAKVMGKTEVASIFKKGKEAIRRGRKSNGSSKKSKEFKGMGQTEMANKIWQKIVRNWRKIFTRKSYKGNVICRVCGNDKAKRKGTKKGKQHVKQPKSIAKKTAKYRRYS